MFLHALRSRSLLYLIDDSVSPSSHEVTVIFSLFFHYDMNPLKLLISTISYAATPLPATLNLTTQRIQPALEISIGNLESIHCDRQNYRNITTTNDATLNPLLPCGFRAQHGSRDAQPFHANESRGAPGLVLQFLRVRAYDV